MAVPQQNEAPNSSPTRSQRQSGGGVSNTYQSPQPDRTRNVRTSSMPGTPLTEAGRTKATIDEEFLADYQTKGIQPQSAIDRPALKSNTSPVTRKEEVEYVRTPTPTTTQKTQKKKVGKIKKISVRTRTSAVNKPIIIWGLYSWLFFQVPFAIFSLIFLGMAGAVEAAKSMVMSSFDTGMNLLDGTFFGFSAGLGLAIVNQFTSTVSDTLLDWFGFDISLLHPATFFMLANSIVLFWGIIMLFIMYLIYKMSLLNPLSGEKAGLKYGVLLLAIIGYFIPFLNLFPWFLIWAVVVWKYPK